MASTEAQLIAVIIELGPFGRVHHMLVVNKLRNFERPELISLEWFEFLRFGIVHDLQSSFPDVAMALK